jgi:hypothetical protein
VRKELKKPRLLLGIQVCLSSFLFFACQTAMTPIHAKPDGGKWYRGNTHAHTIHSVGDASPDEVAAWYHDRGYNFLCITDKNSITDPSSVMLPKNARKDFILIPAEEIAGLDTHATAMNISADIPPRRVGSNSVILQTYEEATSKAGGVLIIDHPNYQWALTTKDIQPLKNVFLFEVYNAAVSAGVKNDGDETHPSTEAMWDELLTDGMRIYAVASDDAADVKYPRPAYRIPGRGWIMVRAEELTPQAICGAMKEGHFYASNGVFLKKLEITSDALEIQIDKGRTEAELSKGSVIGRKAPKGSKAGERIDIIGPGGKVLSSIEGSQASYKIDQEGKTGYVRSRAVVTRQVDGKLVEFCAWAQPFFIPGESE